MRFVLWLMMHSVPVPAAQVGDCHELLIVVPGKIDLSAGPRLLLRGRLRFDGLAKLHLDESDRDSHALNDGDEIYALNAEADVILSSGRLTRRSRLARWRAGWRGGEMMTGEFDVRGPRGRVVAPVATLRAWVGSQTPIVVLRALDADAFATWRARLAAGRVIHRVTQTIDHAAHEDEEVRSGLLNLAYDSVGLATIDWRNGTFISAHPAIITKLTYGDDDAGFRAIERGDLIYFIDGDDELLMRWTARAADLTSSVPFTTGNIAFARMLGRARRVVVVRQK